MTSASPLETHIGPILEMVIAMQLNDLLTLQWFPGKLVNAVPNQPKAVYFEMFTIYSTTYIEVLFSDHFDNDSTYWIPNDRPHGRDSN